MSRLSPLGKKQLNDRFYGTVDPAAAFGTEVQVGFHQVAVARLVVRHAAVLGKRVLRILELGASTCLFANAFLEVVDELAAIGEASLDAIDYIAVDASPVGLSAAIAAAGLRGWYQEIKRGRPPDQEEAVTVLAQLRRSGAVRTALTLVRGDANRFVQGATGRYDVVICNELLDDLPCRVLFADSSGGLHELSADARPEGPRWRVRLTAEPVAPDGDLGAMPPGTLTATSEESLQLVRGIVALEDSGGLLLIHDYGFSERFADAAQYEKPQLGIPPFVELELPESAGLPQAFFRVFGNEEAHAVQLTNDVNFGELAEALEPSGTVITIPHGNQLIRSRTYPDLFFKGDGVFVSEFMLLTAGDDLPLLLSELHEHQSELRARYANTFGEGRTSIFSDLIYVKS